MDEAVDSKKKKKFFRKLIIPGAVLSVLFLTFVILYAFNPKIKGYADAFFKKIPIISNMSQKSPTKQDIEDQKRELAKYYAAMDLDRAADKLMLLKKDDKKFYSEIIQIMREIDYEYAHSIIQEIGIREMKKNTLKRELESMESAKNKEKAELAKNYSQIGLYETVKIIEDKIRALEFDSEYAAGVLSSLKPDFCARVLYYMDFEIADAIKMHLEQDFLKKVEKETISYEKFLGEMQNAASEYQSKDYRKAAEQLSNEELYSQEETANILLFLDPVQAGKIISEIENEDYKNGIIEELVELKHLNSHDDMNDVYAMLNIMGEYKLKVAELSKAYKSMTPKQVAAIARQMTSSNQIYKEYAVGSSIVRITEEELLIEIFKNLTPKFLSEVFVELGTTKSAELTRKMGLPSQEG